VTRRPGAIGRGYLPKGGAPVAARMAREAGKPLNWEERRAQLEAEAAVKSVDDLVPASNPSTGGARAAARSRGGRALPVEGLALVGALSGCSSLVLMVAHVWPGGL
jgi:hypothetical protein